MAFDSTNMKNAFALIFDPLLYMLIYRNWGIYDHNQKQKVIQKRSAGYRIKRHLSLRTRGS